MIAARRARKLTARERAIRIAQHDLALWDRVVDVQLETLRIEIYEAEKRYTREVFARVNPRLR